MTRMRRLIYLILIMLPVGCPCTSWAGERVDTLSVMFWNLENFFDYRDGGTSVSDREFSSFGERHWTKSRFYAKCNAVAKAILWAGSEYGRMPDVIGFAEVENRFVVSSVVGATLLRKYDYGIVHYDSPDPRGIDVALIYRKDMFGYCSSSVHRVHDRNGDMLRTRDILLVVLKSGWGEEFCFIVNHHPSKYGGEKESLPRRIAAMSCLRNIADSLLAEGHRNIIAMGDFNDTPDAEAFGILEGALCDRTGKLSKEGKGTIRYKGKWELIDMVFVSEGLEDRVRTDICPVPFLMADDSSAPGKKPLRTYSGPRYNGGVSDHLPVIGIVESDKTSK